MCCDRSIHSSASSTLKSDSASRLLNANTAWGTLNYFTYFKAKNYFDTGRLDVSRPLHLLGEVLIHYGNAIPDWYQYGSDILSVDDMWRCMGWEDGWKLLLFPLLQRTLVYTGRWIPVQICPLYRLGGLRAWHRIRYRSFSSAFPPPPPPPPSFAMW